RRGGRWNRANVRLSANNAAGGSSVGPGCLSDVRGAARVFFGCKMNLPVDYDMKLGYKLRQPRSLRACSRDDPECGARLRHECPRKSLAPLPKCLKSRVDRSL